jgi:hypothetical protein
MIFLLVGQDEFDTCVYVATIECLDFSDGLAIRRYRIGYLFGQFVTNFEEGFNL